MKECYRCALATLIAAIVLAAAIVTIGLSTGRLMSDGPVKARPAPSIINLQPKLGDRQILIAPDKFDRS